MARKLKELNFDPTVCSLPIEKLSLTREEAIARYGADWDIDHP
jgi:hypothetical protein